MKIHVYTRDVNPDNYPEGLAHSVHFACEDENGLKTHFNRDYGILFAKGRIADDNTIVPLGVRNPKIFQTDDGEIGICAEKIHENGNVCELSAGKLVLWKTRDLIHFDEEEIIPIEETEKWNPSESMDVDQDIVREALKYWCPIFCTDISVPDKIMIPKGK
ncbi:MAG: hypothetical protein K6G22_10155, partial [Lachnospiraceae bacterium]|nr:hypothetical protein [Lachnospiraceae bacterium]